MVLILEACWFEDIDCVEGAKAGEEKQNYQKCWLSSAHSWQAPPFSCILGSQTSIVGGAELLVAQPLILESLLPEVDPGWAGPTGHCRHDCLPVQRNRKLYADCE